MCKYSCVCLLCKWEKKKLEANWDGTVRISSSPDPHVCPGTMTDARGVSSGHIFLYKHK